MDLLAFTLNITSATLMGNVTIVGSDGNDVVNVNGPVAVTAGTTLPGLVAVTAGTINFSGGSITTVNDVNLYIELRQRGTGWTDGRVTKELRGKRSVQADLRTWAADAAAVLDAAHAARASSWPDLPLTAGNVVSSSAATTEISVPVTMRPLCSSASTALRTKGPAPAPTRTPAKPEVRRPTLTPRP